MTLKISSPILTLGTQGPDVTRVHRALRALGRSLPAAETDERVLGSATVAVLKALQQELELPPTGVVDAKTVAAINKKLNARTTEQLVVRGSVRDTRRRPFADASVQLFLQSPAGEKLLGKSALQKADGTYEISYRLPPRHEGPVDVRVAVTGRQGVLETTPNGASVLTDARPLEVVDFVLGSAASPARSEFELIFEDLTGALGEKKLEDLVEDEKRREVSLLSVQTGHPVARVVAQVRAAKLSRETKLPAALFYGLLRLGLPADARALQAAHPDRVRATLEAALSQGLVPKEAGGKKIESYLKDLVAPAPPEIQRLLSKHLRPPEVAELVKLYQDTREAPAVFWKKVAAHRTFKRTAKKVERTVKLGALTNNHAPLAEALDALPEIEELGDLARFDEAGWKRLIRTAGGSVPDETPGKNAEEKRSNYARELATRVEAAFPTRFLGERLGTSPVAEFLKTETDYDVRKTYPAEFFKKNPAAARRLSAEDQRRLHGMQRLYRLTESTAETLALADKGFHSARQIARTDRATFAKEHAAALTEERALAIHDRARRVNAIGLALVAEHGAAFNRTGLAVVPKLEGDAQAALAATSIPDWAELFGSFDACACEECASAHGPAAYFVDTLKFLGERGFIDPATDLSTNVREKLFLRRPDLGHIELSCENTNTPLPYIDLVNEILEDEVAPPSAFQPFDLPSTLEADLAEPLATTALTAAFSPPLIAGARVAILEEGKRWRVWDEPFAYAVEKVGSALKVTARSRQTSGSAAERRATPQYRNQGAYAALAEAVYPWRLPFDLPSEESRVFLKHLGVSRADLIDALHPEVEPFDASSAVVASAASERLGLTDTERRIIAGEPLTPAHQPDDFWGGLAITALGQVSALLERAGLRYAELDELLSTWFVNPDGAVSIAAAGERIDTCNLEELEVQGLSPAVMTRLHRFVRLWRSLGWSVPDVDRAVRALGPSPTAPGLDTATIVRLERLKALCERLHVTVAEGLSLWTPLDTRGPGALYATLFQNESVVKPLDPAFRLASGGAELVSTAELLSEHAAPLQAALRLKGNSLELLIARTNDRLDLENLSFLHRHALLARQLGLGVQDLLTALALSGIDPFDLEHFENTLRFVAFVDSARSAGFSFPQLDYLLAHRSSPSAPFAPTETALAEPLTLLRADLVEIGAAEPSLDAPVLRRSAVVERISSALELAGDVTLALLERVSHGTGTALTALLGIEGIAASPLTRDDAKVQFETLEKLLKVASVVRTLELPRGALDWLLLENEWLKTAPDSTTAPVPALSSFGSILLLRNLRRELGLDSAAVEAVLGAIHTAATAADPLAAKGTLLSTLSSWLDWPREDLEALLGASDDLAEHGLLGVALPGEARLAVVARLQRAMSLLRRVGAGAVQSSRWCEPRVTDASAKEIRAVAKAKHTDSAWQRLAGPLQDVLRDRQREALVSYLLARPAWAENLGGPPTSSDLYAHFLIDVEMTSAPLTSRMKQAMSTAQLFVQRCLMGLEPGVPVNDRKWSEWAWMKNFRVWEANRKIWLYPENWIEPELRDDKTPFFKELETELLQADLDDHAAEQAFSGYLEKLDQVAALEIIGTYEDDDAEEPDPAKRQKTLHVIGRTRHTPRKYFYRSRAGDHGRFGSWEKIDVDIEGDHVIPVVYERKLTLLWAIFTEKAEEKAVKMPPPGGELESSDRYWDIQLAWSQYQRGHWSSKNLSEPVSLRTYIGTGNVLFGKAVSAPDPTLVARRVNDSPDPEAPMNALPFQPFDIGIPGFVIVFSRSYLVEKHRVVFKGLVSQGMLRVRGFLRRDYRPAPESSDTQIACPFGDFVFGGCRKIVTQAHGSQMPRRNFPLAPASTEFDGVSFSGAGNAGGLMLLDGTFPTFPGSPHAGNEALIDVNEPASIAGALSPTFENTVQNRIDIPVLTNAPKPFSLLAPHQDLQFVGDRPFFYMDPARTLMVTSTGKSGKRNGRPDLGTWAAGDLATVRRRDYFPEPVEPAPDAPSPTTTSELAPLTVLARAPHGERMAVELPGVSITASVLANTALPTFWTTRKYHFENFYHPYVCDFVKRLNRHGLGELLSLDTQLQSADAFVTIYGPKPVVAEPYPADSVEFETGTAYEAYNWELFFHVPFLIADRLSKNQRFEDAQRWFHFIFDPTGAKGGDTPQRYWLTKPFHERTDPEYAAESVKEMERWAAEGTSASLNAAVAYWRANPFSPHAIARLRTTAYQKAVVMKYIDNLVAWGDQLFRRETLESIGEAAQLYVLAGEILGRRPEVIRRRLKPRVETFDSLLPKLGALGNALESLELIAGSVFDESTPDATDGPQLPEVLYFCVPENDKLLGYFRTVEDRLFKIRHSMNIEGQVRTLPLFEPPIDPALLVRARAAGLSLGDVLGDLSSPLPKYRFSVMAQKAAEVVGEVRNFGNALLSVLEKRDAEALSTLRAGQELRLLEAVRDVRVQQLEEAKANVKALEQSQAMATAKKEFYKNREAINFLEAAGMTLSVAAQLPLTAKAATDALAVVVNLIPDAKTGAPTSLGFTLGGSNVGKSTEASGRVQEAASMLLNMSSLLTNRLAEFLRRKEDWDHQGKLADLELKQIAEQLLAASIRVASTEQELRNHDLQIKNSKEVVDVLRSKFTNEDLYQWMIGQVSALYFQSYQLAYDLARRAERCLQHELGFAEGSTSHIRFGYWDSLKKGLLAGDHLALALKRLEVAYLDGNAREFELTKHVSLAALAPGALIELKEGGECTFDIPEWLFDLDTPGHFKRRLKTVSLTIPCVTGPYTTIHVKATLLESSCRQSAEPASPYPRIPEGDPGAPDTRFVDFPGGKDAIVTSTGQNDAGLFEVALRDERYLPFEGAGAISRWKLELSTDLPTFDHASISDVILHLRYTAKDDETLRGNAKAAVNAALADAASAPLVRAFSLRHEFPSEWRRFVSTPASAASTMTVDLATTRFPYFSQRHTIEIQRVSVIAVPKTAPAPELAIAPGTVAPTPGGDGWEGAASPGPWTISTSSDPASLGDVLVLVAYRQS